MGSFIDRTGEVFGDLTVIRCVQRASRGNGRKTKWLCRCSCGDLVEVVAGNLVSGNSTCCMSCRAEHRVIHGDARRVGYGNTYKTWCHMKARCLNPKLECYGNYGGRGITFCEEWKYYSNFLKDMGYKPKNLTLERIDVDKGYCKDNCKWASRSEQSYNRRKSKYNTSGVEGVSLRRDTGRWTAYINIDCKRHSLGCFDTKEEAIEARRNKEIELYGKIKEN